MRYGSRFALARAAAVAMSYLSALLVIACVAEPVDWGDVGYRESKLGDPGTRNTVVSANLPSIGGAVAQCLRSIRTVSADSDLFQVWWTARSDSSVVLAMQHSSDRGARWGIPVVVETRDHGRRACNRPAPGIFYDSVRGYLHLVYFIEAKDGAGVFFAHSMDKGGMFHSPVPVVYGNAPVTASVAANGDSVVVVFEDPNAMTPRIGIVLSHSTGHIFEARGEATPDDVPAVEPWVTLDHRTVTVWWKPGENAAGQSGSQLGYRTGVWQ